MVKIPFQKIDYGGTRYLVNMLFKSDRIRKPAPIQAIFDTGSQPALVLSEKEGQRLQIPFSSLEKGSIIGLATQKYETYYIKDANVVLYGSNEERIEVAILITIALRCTKRSKDALMESYQLPNLIGLDFLKAGSFTQHIDEKGDLFLEKV
jgi:hypothetical protein